MEHLDNIMLSWNKKDKDNKNKKDKTEKEMKIKYMFYSDIQDKIIIFVWCLTRVTRCWPYWPVT